MIPTINIFRQKKGSVSGVIISGYGLGSFAFSFIAYALINPNDESPNSSHIFPENVAQNLPFALRILGIIYCAVTLTGSLL
jgi:hypothetical protein